MLLLGSLKTKFPELNDRQKNNRKQKHKYLTKIHKSNSTQSRKRTHNSRLVVAHLQRSQHVAQLNRIAALHVLHRRRKLGRRNAPILERKLLARSLRLPIATLAEHLDHFATRRIRTIARMTRSLTLVAAHHTQLRAILLAHIGGQLTATRMTQFDALVATALQRPLARHAAREFALTAGYRFAFLVVAVAENADEGHARWTVGGRVTVVRDGMRARMLARTWFVTGWFLRAARNRRIDDLSTAFAVEFDERGAITTLAATLVAGLVTLVLAACQIKIARKWTDVIDVDAALLVAFVFAAVTLLDAPLLATGIVRTGQQLTAFHHLLHVATATTDGRFLGARRTVAGVTLGRTRVRIGRLSARQRTLAGGLAQRNRIGADLPRTNWDGRLSAWTRGHVLR